MILAAIVMLALWLLAAPGWAWIVCLLLTILVLAVADENGRRR